ncbi:peptidoglycan editing factor PgeF [Acidovorax sacchari]|uniref:peptidoglycan editing factor PgeF n=1 Tax=Acidovorax sacchari TaxID=3230736 RepID=UPI0039E25EC1
MPGADALPPAAASLPDGWLRPDWPAPGHVHAVCTARPGGVSRDAWAALNLGDHVGDDPDAVRANRQYLRARLADLGGGPAVAPIFLRQVHGTAVADLDRGVPDGTEADACIARLPGRACTIMVADCLPVLLTDRQGCAVAAAHAGWRGLAGGVLEQALARLDADGGVLAWLGPCIGPTAFEVGEEVREAFCAQDAGAGTLFSPQGGGKYLADLPGLARRRLGALGVAGVWGNDGGDGWCTVRQASRFFSHRASVQRFGSTGGRFAACIWLGSRGG